MPICTGCSKLFKFLDAARCEPCMDILQVASAVSKPKNEWPVCIDCSKRYEFLSAAQCFVCKEKESQSMPPPLPPSNPSVTSAHGPLLSQDQNRFNDIQYAMRNAANPRTHGHVPYHNPFQQSRRGDLNENDPRSAAAQSIFDDFQSGYIDAVERVHPHTRVSKSKFRGAEISTIPAKPVLRINVVVRKIINRNSKSLSTPFDAQMNTYEETKLWSEIEANIVVWLDGIYSRVFNHHIRSRDEITVHYNHGHCQIDPILTLSANTTLKDIWKKSIEQPGVLVLIKHQKTHILELECYVDYPPRPSTAQSDDDFMSDFGQNSLLTNTRSGKSRKRRAEVEDSDASTAIRPYKFGGTSGRTSNYFTNITGSAARVPSANQDAFKVVKLTAVLETTEKGTQSQWRESAESFHIVIDKEAFDSGKTKKVYKLQFSNSSTIYAAKSFYNIGSDEDGVSQEDDLRLLKEELLRQLAIQTAGKAFNEAAKEAKIAIYDLQFADSFILKVKDGLDDGKAWLVDPMLDSKRMKKFSGTNRAGVNNDFGGKTCDTFAHFTLIDSGIDFVPTDIQGIDTPVVKNGIQGANAIILFDLMGHSKMQTMGLGDEGLDGIRKFCQQHQCNSICYEFKLQDLSTILDLDASEKVSDLGLDATDNSKNLEDGELEDL